jgi:hypothetical protein
MQKPPGKCFWKDYVAEVTPEVFSSLYFYEFHDQIACSRSPSAFLVQRSPSSDIFQLLYMMQHFCMLYSVEPDQIVMQNRTTSSMQMFASRCGRLRNGWEGCTVQTCIEVARIWLFRYPQTSGRSSLLLSRLSYLITCCACNSCWCSMIGVP